MAGLSGITQVAAGWDHSLALSSDGTVWAWGNNTAGELGNGTTARSLTPVQGLSRVTSIAAGAFFGMAVQNRNLYTVLNQVMTWGQDTDATIGERHRVLVRRAHSAGGARPQRR